MQLPRNEGNFIPPPAGSHIAICTRFIDLGTQDGEWQGKAKKIHKSILTWELSNEAMDDGRPFTVNKWYTWSTSEKANLRHDLESWRARAFNEADFSGPNPFDIRNILGKPCMLSIVHVQKDGTTYGNIAGVSKMPKDIPVPTQINATVYVALQADLFDRDTFGNLPDKLKETIKASPEYRKMFAASTTDPLPGPDDYGANDMSDEIPF